MITRLQNLGNGDAPSRLACAENQWFILLTVVDPTTAIMLHRQMARYKSSTHFQTKQLELQGRHNLSPRNLVESTGLLAMWMVQNFGHHTSPYPKITPNQHEIWWDLLSAFHTNIGTLVLWGWVCYSYATRFLTGIQGSLQMIGNTCSRNKNSTWTLGSNI